LVQTQGKEDAMSQHQQPWRSGSNDMSWLSMLVDTFEKISRPDLRAVPCSEPVLTALKAQLVRPAMPRGGRGPDFRLLN
jgi:hypothetical protein